MTYIVRIMPEAYTALKNNVVWWADHHSLSQALMWYKSFVERLHSLTDMPESYPFARENRRTSYELRELHFSLGRRISHRALFRIRDKTVEVLTIRHVAQDDLSDEELR